jgi:hemoglobin/transferrin/lactoferrin receptor protein
MKNFYWGILCLLTILYTPSFAQTKFQIIDDITKEPVSGVLITQLYPTDAVVKSTSDKNGFATVKFDGSRITLSNEDYYPLVIQQSSINKYGQVFLTPNIQTMDETVISASRNLEKRKDVAQKVQVMRAKEIQFQNQSSTADLMTQTGNVFVQKSQLGGGSPIIRGFETNKVLLVVDGVRMNNAIYRGGHLQNIVTIDNAMLDRVEVIYGPGSVVYGSDALGGVMSFTTKNPTLSTTDELVVKSGGFARYFSAATGYAANANVSVGSKRFGSLTSFTYSNYGDLRQGAVRSPFVGNFGSRPWYVERINGVDSMMMNADTNLQVGSAYTQYDILQKFTFVQKEGVTHKLNVQLSNSSNIDRYDRLTLMSGSKPKFAEWYYGPQFRLFAAYTLELKNKTKLYDQARITLGTQSIEESRMDRRFNKSMLNHRIENVAIASINADFTKKIGRNELRYGVDAYYNKANSTAYVEDIVADTTGSLDTRFPDGGSTMISIAAYATHTIEFSNKLILNDGLRFSNVGLSSNFIDKTYFPLPVNSIQQNNSALNGNIGLIYMPNNKWRVTLTGSTGFRAPNVDDMTKVFESVPGKVVVPNANLKPEYTYNAELGISRLVATGVTASVNGYYTYLVNGLTVQNGTFEGQDSIIYDGQLSQVMSTVNAAKSRIFGIEGMLNAKLNDQFNLLATVNYTNGRILTDSVPYPLDHIPPTFGKVSLGYVNGKLRSEFFVNYSGWKRVSDYNMIGEDNFAYATVDGMPSWYTLNVRLNYAFSQHVSLQIACENILNQNYRSYASNISAPGRNIIVTLRGQF